MKQDNNHNFEAKWTRPIAKSGYTNIPNLLIENQANLEITNGEMVVLIGLLKHRWTTSNPYPSVGTLSKHSGMAQQTIRKHLRCLERKKILKRV